MADYSFVPYIERKTYNRQGKKEYSGYYDLRITTMQPMRIGSGSYRTNPDCMAAEIMLSDNVPVIPGASLKGCVRAIAGAASASCIPRPAVFKKGDTEHREFRSHNQTRWASNICKTQNDIVDRCIVCDLFGMMGFASRVDFDDFKAKGNYTIQINKIPAPFSPDPWKNIYFSIIDGKKESNGRKFYYTKAEHRYATRPAPNLYEAESVAKNTIFEGRIYFRKVTEEQLSLLFFSLGLDGSFLPKLGGNRVNNYGSVRITELNPIVYLGDKPSLSPIDLAKKYGDENDENVDDDIFYNARDIREIMEG